MSFVYIDLMKMVRPINALEDGMYDFFFLGEFDAMNVDISLDTIEALQHVHKLRYREIPPHYERQPLYLYAKGAVGQTIFSRSDEYALRPLVMSMFQIDDFELRDNMNPDAIIDAFDAKISAILDELKVEQTKKGDCGLLCVDFQSLWNLGGSSMVVIFRTNNMQAVGRLLFRLQSWENASTGIRLLSTSSHCAFPSTSDIKTNFHEWLENDTSFTLFTLTNTSYGLSDIGVLNKQTEFLFGKWEHTIQWPIGREDEVTDFFQTRIAKPAKYPNPKEPMPFRTTYTIPRVSLEDSDCKTVEDANLRTIYHFPRIYSDTDWLYKMYPAKDEDNAFVELEMAVRAMNVTYGKSNDMIANTIKSLGSTVASLAMHLYRLLVDNSQGDLYAFVRPVFEAVVSLTKDMSNRLTQLYSAYNTPVDEEEKARCCRHINRLLNSYIQDLSQIITQVQYIFSVFSVSLHTLQVTVVSNMNNLAAARKLIVAYQGITYALGKVFKNDLVENGKTAESKKVSMVLPYHNITSSNRRLFPQTTPKIQLYSIQMNYADMLCIPQALFVLLHECGHQLIWQDLRMERAQSYSRAVISCVLSIVEQSEYDDIERDIVEPLKRGGNYQYYRLSVKPEVLFLARNLMKEIFEKLNNLLCLSFQEQFEIFVNKSSRIFDPLSMSNCELYYIRNCMVNFLKKLSSQTNWKTMLTPVIREVLNIYHLIIESIMEDDSYFDRSDRREILFLERYYWTAKEDRTENIQFEIKDTHEKIENVYNRISDYIRNNCEAICGEFDEVYIEIYSDIFAIVLLGLTYKTASNQLAEGYCSLCFYEAGAIRDEIIIETSKLIRMSVVLRQCYAITTASEIVDMFRRSGLAEVTCIKAKCELETIQKMPYFQEILRFASACQQRLEVELVNDVRLKEVSEMLRNMYSPHSRSTVGLDDTQIMNSIYYFWKESTRRNDE